MALFLQCASDEKIPTEWTVQSPGERVSVKAFLNADGQAVYQVFFGEKTVIDTSSLGFAFEGQAPLAGGLRVKGSAKESFSETWETVWGEDRFVVNNFNELTLMLEETAAPNRRFRLVFRVYDDGLGFRYEFPEQEALGEVRILEENTEFRLTGDHMCWWQPGDWDIYEHLYNTTRFTEIDAISKRDHPNLAQTYIPNNAVNTPVTMKTDDGIYLSFHEAALYDYSDMTLLVDKENLSWKSCLVGGPDSYKAKVQTPFHTPWRSIQIADKAGDLIESKLILNLNEPNKIEDVSWIKPTKYAGIWWEMHLGMSSWDMAGKNHGATTANAKRYIDFAAANNIPAILIEGWNTGWEDWWGDAREYCFDFVTPYADFDIEEVVRYGKEKGVRLIGHHETASGVARYEQQLDTAFQFLEKMGISAVKTGYVGTIFPKGHYHHGQFMVNHYQRVVETAARHRVMVDAHEPIKDTGIRRTWPNFMTREGLRGQEFEAWSSDKNPPEHLVIVPFTRMLAGPVDYTPGIFNIKFDEFKKDNQVNTTLAKQLALYATIYSPMQMVADLPQHYEGHPAMQFIRDVAVDWDESRVLNAEIGQYLTMARKERGAERWFIGSITNEEAREFSVPLDFLPEGKTWQATIYADAPDAHWDKNPTAYVIENKTVQKGERLELKLAPGGGVAVVLKEGM
jgi:glucan 1,4-alpha-glucosidase